MMSEESKENNLNELQKTISEVQTELKELQILVRVNNLLMSKFILKLSNVIQDCNLPKRVTFFRFELLEQDYNTLVNEFGKEETDRALYRLDRLLIQNKQQCPNNIKQYISNRLKKRAKRNNYEDK